MDIDVDINLQHSQHSQQTGEPPPKAPSWAEIAGTVNRKKVSSLPVDSEVLEKLRTTVTQSIRVDAESKLRAKMRFQYALYGKIFGKAPAFEIVKTSLQNRWSMFGVFHISDMLNGFILVRCETDEAKQKLLYEGPWTVSGFTLELMLWQPYFDPVFTKLSKAMIWIQLHNLPVDFWDGESLESLTEPIGKLLKVDECTSTLSRTRFARVYLEIDLALPLKKGFWLEDEENKVFVLVLYERLPTYYFTCGLVVHGITS